MIDDTARKKPCLRVILFSASILAIAIGTLGMQGCTSVGIADPLKYDGRTTTTAAHALLPDQFEVVNLPSALDPSAFRVTAMKRSADDIDAAFRAFYESYPAPEERRNRLQDRLLAASEQRCGIYKHYLRRVESMQSTYSGVITTVLGGAGAIAQSVSGAQALSALAAISSGVGAELKQGMFANLAADVISAGIDERRKELRQEIAQKRAPNPGIQSYTMEAALEDVARYHESCGAIAGLAKARDTIKEVSNPGLQTMSTVLLGQEKLRIRMQKLKDDPSSAELDQPLFSAGLFEMGPDSANPYGYWRGQLSQLQDRLKFAQASVKAAADELEKQGKNAAALKALLAGGEDKPFGKLEKAVNDQFDRVKNTFVDLTTTLIDKETARRTAEDADRQGKVRELVLARAEFLKEKTLIDVYRNAIADGLGKIEGPLARADAARITATLTEAANIKVK